MLAYQSGFEVGRYISLERIIEQSKDRYYENLRLSSQGWHERRHDVHPFLGYMLFVVASAYREFEQRVHALPEGKGAKSRLVENVVMMQAAPFKLADILSKCPGVSRGQVKVMVRKMKAEGTVKPLGLGRDPWWAVGGGDMIRVHTRPCYAVFNALLLAIFTAFPSRIIANGLNGQICGMEPKAQTAFLEASKLSTYGEEYFVFGGTKMEDTAAFAYMKDFGFLDGEKLVAGSSSMKRNALFVGGAFLASGIGLFYLGSRESGRPDNAVYLLFGLALTAPVPFQIRSFSEGFGSRKLACRRFNELLEKYADWKCR